MFTRGLLTLAIATAPFVASADSARSSQASPRAHLHLDGTTFRTPDGQVFQWRGITAFRLLDYVAHGRSADAEHFLAWAAGQGLTVVRVLAMGAGWMDLTPAEGRVALPRLLEMASAHGLHVEIVALAGTADIRVDLAEQVGAIGRIASEHPNALLEIANEPVHPTQAPEVHKPEVLASLASRVREVPVALGAEENDGFAAGDYVTWHVPRVQRFDGWGHVVEIARGAGMLRRWKKPVISDEPIGAGRIDEPGRRDNDPSRFRAAGLLTRLAGLGATFHYEGGLQTSIPAGPELACFNAWSEAWTQLPADIEIGGEFRRSGDKDAAVASFDTGAALAVFERQRGPDVWVLVLNVRGEPALKWAPGWRQREIRRFDRVWVISARRES